MPDIVDILVIGGGISGVSLAARLAPHARVAVVEADDHIGMQATGRSAALLVEAYGEPQVRRLTKASRPFFETPPEGFSDVPLSRRRGAVVYGGEADIAALRREFELARETASVVWLEGEEIRKCCPLLRPGVAAAGFLEPDVLDLDTHALLQGFARAARQHGAEIWTGAPVRRIERMSGGWEIEAGTRQVACGVVVDAAGAWADEIAALAGVCRRELQPKRRTAATMPVPAGLADVLPRHPFVIPIDGSFYFKPEAGAIMVSLSDETPSWPCDAQPDELAVALALERFHAATVVPRNRPIAAWAGLRTFAPDRLPILGFDPGAEGFFWYAGQGGTGIQTSPAHSTLAAKLLLGGELDAAEARIGVAFSATRTGPGIEEYGTNTTSD